MQVKMRFWTIGVECGGGGGETSCVHWQIESPKVDNGVALGQ